MNRTISVRWVVNDTSVMGRYQGGLLRRMVSEAIAEQGEVEMVSPASR